VLIADDDDDLRTLLARRLTRRGWQVTEAADGTQALLAATDAPPDVVVLDRSMPGLTGPEVLAQLRARPATAGIPVLMLSAEDPSGMDADAVRPDASLRKPFEIAVLDAELHRLAGR
jgi:DNA-binding response OmpR family regulator